MCPSAALPQLAPWLKERGRRPKYCFTAAMDEEIRHAYHLYVDYNNRKAKKWLCSSGWGTSRTPSSNAS